jgi:hypothetical protein
VPAVATWYLRGGPLSADAIVSMYRQLALTTVGYRDAATISTAGSTT